MLRSSCTFTEILFCGLASFVSQNITKPQEYILHKGKNTNILKNTLRGIENIMVLVRHIGVLLFFCGFAEKVKQF